MFRDSKNVVKASIVKVVGLPTHLLDEIRAVIKVGPTIPADMFKNEHTVIGMMFKHPVIKG
jgi:hypothetical protein